MWYEGLEIYYGGSAGNPVTWTAYGTGEPPIIKGSNLATSWTQSGDNWYTSYGGQVAGGGTAHAYGVWEDGAPLFSVAALADIRSGTFFWDSVTSRLYIRTYENDNPTNHTMEHSRYWYPSASAISIADSTGGVATDYIVIENIRAEKGRNAGVSIIANAHAKNSITLQNMVIAQNFTGVIYSGTYAQTITINNSTIWGNAYTAILSYNLGANAATVNVKNSILGGTLFFNTFEPATGGTINIDHSIVSGNLMGRYFLTTVNNGTLTITNTSYNTPRFASAGGNELGVATFNSDDSGGPGYHLSVANIFNSRGLKYTWSITSKLDQNQWTEVNNVLAANQIISMHTRNHNQMSSSPGGSDIANAFAVNYTGGTTVTASYADPIFTLSVDGVTTNIDVSTENVRTCGVGTFDTTYLGNATHGLIGCINALSGNYVAAYPTTASASISRTGSAYYVSSRVLADQTNVNIKSPNCSTTIGCIALDATRYYNSEIFTAGQRDGEYADWDAQSGAIAGYTTVSFAWPFEEWSVAGIARLYEKGFRTAYGGDTVNSMGVARRLLFNQLYPLNLPIAAPYASGLKMTMNTTQNGIDEAENTAAVLDTYPAMHVMFSHTPTEASLDAVTSYIDTLQTEGITIMDRAAATALDEASGGVWDTASYTITRKIIPAYNFRLKSDSPAIDAGTNVSLTSDCAGNSVPQGSAPDIGAYEHIPLTVSVVLSTPTSSGSTITWTTNENSSSKVDYGLTNSYGSATSETDTSTRVTSHSVALSSLSACTTYHYRVRSKDVATNETVDSDNTFTTSGCTGSSSVSATATNQITITSGGTLTLQDGNSHGLTLTVPASFGGSNANFQAHQLDKDTTLATTSKPENQSLAGNYLYELKALTDNSTTLSTFNTPLTVTIAYGASDIVGIDESSLKIYRYDGSGWTQLSGCSVNTTAKIATCTTSNFSVFGLFGLTIYSAPGVPVCTNTIPTGPAPWLYEANAKDGNSTTLRFTNWQSPVDHFALEYGTSSNNYQYAADNIGGSDTKNYLVKSLSPNTTYYFRVRAGNGCATGDWSNEISAKTKSRYSAFAKSGLETEIIDTELKKKEEKKGEEKEEELKKVGYDVKIKVVDTDKKAVKGAKVTLFSKPIEARTDKDGVALFKNVEPGEHRVVISYKWQTGEQKINLQENMEVDEIDFTIQIKPTNPFLNPWVIGVIAVLVLTLVGVTLRAKRRTSLE